MKIFAFIMAFLVLALSVMPCADIDNTANNNNAKTEVTKSNQNKDNSQQDDCSPFCHCTCCAGFSVNHFITSIVFIPSYIVKIRAVYLPADAIEIALPIWQPPQLV